MATQTSHSTKQPTARKAPAKTKPDGKTKVSTGAKGLSPAKKDSKPKEDLAKAADTRKQPAAEATREARPSRAPRRRVASGSNGKPNPGPDGDGRAVAEAKSSRSVAVSKPAGTKRAPRKSARSARPSTRTRVAAPSPTIDPERVILNLKVQLEAFTEAHHLGLVAGATTFDLGLPEELTREADLAFVSFDRWAEYRRVPTHHRWHVVPDLMIHVDRGPEAPVDWDTLVAHAFQAGVRRVWIIDPATSSIRDFQAAGDPRSIGRGQALDGGDVLPGLHLPLGQLLEENAG